MNISILSSVTQVHMDTTLGLTIYLLLVQFGSLVNQLTQPKTLKERGENQKEEDEDAYAWRGIISSNVVDNSFIWRRKTFQSSTMTHDINLFIFHNH